jgi:uncharacterized UBP type Zn finger protein
VLSSLVSQNNFRTVFGSKTLISSCWSSQSRSIKPGHEILGFFSKIINGEQREDALQKLVDYIDSTGAFRRYVQQDATEFFLYFIGQMSHNILSNQDHQLFHQLRFMFYDNFDVERYEQVPNQGKIYPIPIFLRSTVVEVYKCHNGHVKFNESNIMCLPISLFEHSQNIVDCVENFFNDERV